MLASFRRAVGDGRRHRRFVFVELFCGKGCITAALKADGFAAVGFDISRGAHENHLVHEFFEVLHGWVTAGCVAGIWLGTPCTTWSQALRRPLRSRRHPMGLPGLSPGEQARLDVGNATFKFTCKVIRLAMRWKVAVYLENPAGSLMWHAPELARLLRAASAQKVQLHMCQFGAPWRKATTVAAWFSLPLLNLGLCCSGRSGICSKTKKLHVILSGHAPHGPHFTRLAAEYPKAFAQKFSRVMQRSFEDKRARNFAKYAIDVSLGS